MGVCFIPLCDCFEANQSRPNAFSCGRDGDQCRPFDNQTYNFRCPASCGNTQVLNPYTVGATTINYHTLVVGGPTEKEGTYENIYRGDSFVCSAAVHAGIISNKDGGCLTASLIGTQPNFPSVTQNGITSIGFNSSFPLAMTLKKRSEGGKQSSSAACSDPQWRALGVSVTFTSILSLFTTSSALFYCATFVSTFFQTALASDAPYSATFDGVVSTAMSRLLPAVFVGLIIYFYCVRYTLRRLRAQVEKTVLWLGACWVGVLSNYTLEKIPLQRLTPHDIKQQPGAIVALVFIVLILVTISCLQAWTFRNEGRLARYLGIYALLGTFVLLLLAIPRLNLRIHHYILALLLLPMTKIQTRPSLLYQGLLVGLFINGIARWGFASILQTSAELQGDARFTNALPIITTPTVSGNNITFSIGLEDGYNGLSALVNDVERFRVFGQSNNTISWMKQVGDTTEYFRFAYFKYDSFGAAAQVYTQAGIWNDDGSWTHMPPGPSSN
ncbi:hypothetical protein EJ08DRAFT_92845 [Tothia fuscella]|uniref:LCCL domain-containing protein n=1 Tax=Tothia fuscella TaxID=1048955 RepID=A0A9P4U033_9PEZI|nr:hypothetical protein EJ08DRAFT_92845 [Tothia fuscella]